MTTFIFIKHTQSVLETLPTDVMFPPDSEISLTENGQEIAERIAQNLMAVIRGNLHIYSSPRFRCMQMANVLASSMGVDSVSDDRLDERRIFSTETQISLQEYRSRQERGYLNPFKIQNSEVESPISHRLRVESWLAETIATSNSEDVYLVISHGSVVEHLHSSLHWSPAGAMTARFTFCAPGHAHFWRSIELPDEQSIWCCLGANISLVNSESFATQLQGFDDLTNLAIDLATDPRFQELVQITLTEQENTVAGDYYIR
jgi:broad specificity phosphatase PhoE